MRVVGRRVAAPDNRHDFEVLSRLLSELYPDTTPLRVEAAPDIRPG
jgi:hypothetical protein